MRQISWFAGAATVALALGSAAIGVPSAAYAQAVGATNNQGIEEISVTARREVERAQDVPISMTVLSQKELNQSNITYAGDLSLYVPSLGMDPLFGNNNIAFSLRGFSQDTPTQPTVGTYFAEVAAPHSGLAGNAQLVGETAGPGDLFDLQNIQVLKGPQGTLFGINTTGGDVLLVPTRPKDEFGGYVEASGGNYGMERVQAVINIPVNDHLRLRFAVEQETRNGYLKNVEPAYSKDAFNNVNFIDGRLSVDWDVTSKLNNYTIASYLDSNDNGTAQQLFYCTTSGSALQPVLGPLACAQLAKEKAAGPDAVGEVDPTANSLLKQYRVINNTTYELADNLTIKNIASFTRVTTWNSIGLFGDGFVLPSYFGPTSAGKPFDFVESIHTPGIPTGNQNNFTEELQVQGHFLDDRLNWQGGLYMQNDFPATATQGYLTPQLLSCTNANAFKCTDALGLLFGAEGTVGGMTNAMATIIDRDWAAYTQADYAITDELKLTAGVRYTADNTSSTQNFYFDHFPAPNTVALGCQLPGTTVAQNCLLTPHSDSSAPTWLLNLQYKPIPELMTFAEWARGYRAGGISLFAPPGYNTFEAERLDDFEVGFKSDFEGLVSGYFDATAFYDKFGNQQLSIGAESSTGQAPAAAAEINAGRSQIFGTEVDGAIKPTDNLTLTVGYSWLYSEILAVTTPTAQPGSLYNIFTGDDAVGSPLPTTPKHKITLSATYDLPVDPEMGEMSIGTTFNYTAKQFLGSEPMFSYLPSHTLLNFNASWRDIYGRPVDAEFFMTNALNTVYPTWINDFSSNLGWASRNLGEPRMFGARLRYHF